MDPYLCKSIDISSFEACSINDSRFPPYKYNLFCQMVNYSSYKTSVYLDNHLVYRNESKTSTFTTSKSTKFNILFEAALISTSKDIIWSFNWAPLCEQQAGLRGLAGQKLRTVDIENLTYWSFSTFYASDDIDSFFSQIFNTF